MDEWYGIAERATWKNFAEVKATFPQTHLVGAKRGQKLIFDVKGNHYRIVCLVRDRKSVV